MNLPVIANVIAFVLVLVLLYIIPRPGWSLSRKVMLGLVAGILFGLVLHLIYGPSEQAVQESIIWFNIVGDGYVSLLRMIVMPLVFVSILGAVTKLHNASSLGKISILVLGTLLLTTMVAACIGIFVSHLFHLSAAGLIPGTQELQRLETINSSLLGRVANLNVPDLILSFIPKNPFAALADPHTTAIISVVLFAVLLGIAALQLHKDHADKAERIFGAIELLQLLVMKLVRMVMLLTPYGVMALMTKVVANSNLKDIVHLGSFIVASYLGLLLILLLHSVLLAATGISPWRFFKKVWPVLTFAFTSRSSAATIPLNIEAQTFRLGVPDSIASFSAFFGATIGQNGCAGLYPAMLSVMVAPTVGINPMDPVWIITLVTVVTISSVGVAGVGGGATFAALIVLPTMGLPVELVALLISIEPLIDMGRTAINVSGSMTAGAVTSQLLRQTDKTVLQQE